MNTSKYVHDQQACDPENCLDCIRQENQRRYVDMNTSKYAHDQKACDSENCLHCIRQENQRLKERIEALESQIAADLDSLESRITELEAIIVP